MKNQIANKTNTNFDPTKHLTKIQGRDYLEVKWRLVWFRQDHPDWTIETHVHDIHAEKMYAIFRATIKDEIGRVIATATKVETKIGFSDYVEKAETGAVGRALALCGYGTQFAPEFREEHRIVDAPVKSDGDTLNMPEITPAEERETDAGASDSWQRDQVTVKQIEKIQRLTRSHFREDLAKRYALKEPMEMSKGQASEWINELLEAKKAVSI